jgi:hypothetical protein
MTFDLQIKPFKASSKGRFQFDNLCCRHLMFPFIVFRLQFRILLPERPKLFDDWRQTSFPIPDLQSQLMNQAGHLFQGPTLLHVQA